MVAANKGVQQGWLVPLSAGLCYVGKQGCFMPRSSIRAVLFHRTGGGSATFDITIKCAGAAAGTGGGAAKPFELGQIDAAELPKLHAYCADQRIKVMLAYLAVQAHGLGRADQPCAWLVLHCRMWAVTCCIAHHLSIRHCSCKCCQRPQMAQQPSWLWLGALDSCSELIDDAMDLLLAGLLYDVAVSPGCLLVVVCWQPSTFQPCRCCFFHISEAAPSSHPTYA